MNESSIRALVKPGKLNNEIVIPNSGLDLFALSIVNCENPYGLYLSGHP
jgi:hypothetical protein